jgi:hypothetical protein
MKSKSIRALVMLLIATGVPVAAGTARGDVSQTPVATACPAGFELLSVAALEAVGPYKVPRLVDTAGNSDGYVCGNEQPDSVRDAFCRIEGGNVCLLVELGLPRYLFKDDDSPAFQNAPAA